MVLWCRLVLCVSTIGLNRLGTGLNRLDNILLVIFRSLRGNRGCFNLGSQGTLFFLLLGIGGFLSRLDFHLLCHASFLTVVLLLRDGVISVNLLISIVLLILLINDLWLW